MNPQHSADVEKCKMLFVEGIDISWSPTSFPISGGRLRDETEEGRHEAKGPPDQLAQVHGHLPEAAHVLLALRRLHLVRGEEENDMMLLASPSAV